MPFGVRTTMKVTRIKLEPNGYQTTNGTSRDQNLATTCIRLMTSVCMCALKHINVPINYDDHGIE